MIRKQLLLGLGSMGVVTVALLSMLGMFWVLDLFPILLFIGMILVYGFFSANATKPKDRKKNPGDLITSDSHVSRSTIGASK